MTYAFDTKSAAFSPDHVTTLKTAFDSAIHALEASRDGSVPEATAAKLGKVLVNLAREALKHDLPLAAPDLAERAGRYIATLREQGLLE